MPGLFFQGGLHKMFEMFGEEVSRQAVHGAVDFCASFQVIVARLLSVENWIVHVRMSLRGGV